MRQKAEIHNALIKSRLRVGRGHRPPCKLGGRYMAGAPSGLFNLIAGYLPLGVVRRSKSAGSTKHHASESNCLYKWRTNWTYTLTTQALPLFLAAYIALSTRCRAVEVDFECGVPMTILDAATPKYADFCLAGRFLFTRLFLIPQQQFVGFPLHTMYDEVGIINSSQLVSSGSSQSACCGFLFLDESERNDHERHRQYS